MKAAIAALVALGAQPWRGRRFAVLSFFLRSLADLARFIEKGFPGEGEALAFFRSLTTTLSGAAPALGCVDRADWAM
ncbi:MAG: hypothetical protein CFK52_04235 [Chloracidobacterium sp. CP2_5A]|nr:MAG: hypothetical protein CFK52_04235 [Chloracidobacterium sp. CP2_5A]